MNLVTYVPARDTLGRFKPSKKKVFKTLFVVAALASFYGNYLLASKIWNFKCSEGGYFTTKEKCGEIAQFKFDSQEMYRLQRVQAMENEQALDSWTETYQ